MSKVHLVGNAHLDPAWLWRWQEGYSEALATFRSALDRLKEFPEMKFTSACAVYYQWVEQMDPGMFAEIQEMVRQGRWTIVGGWYLQPDCNLPDGESFLRHTLLSQRYFQEKFGVIAKTGYNVDSFGHNAGLPKILKAGGMDNYVFMRPSVEEQGRPEQLFWWESDDGSRVCACRIPIYGITEHWVSMLQDIHDKPEPEQMMGFFGVGNHGGGPTIRTIHAINELKLQNALYSDPDTFFHSLDKSTLPTIADELQHHARGCYSTVSAIKTGNRKCEQNLLAAEKFCTMATELTGLPYPAEGLKKGWENVLFNQFHDIMGGCSVQSVYQDAAWAHGETMSITEQAINAALQRIAWNIDTLQGEPLPSYKLGIHNHWTVWEHEKLGTPVVVFNPHPWKVRQTVQIYATAARMTDAEGNDIPFQTVRGEQTNNTDLYHTAFLAEVPAMGYAVYRLFVADAPLPNGSSCLNISETVLENDCIRLELNPATGDVCRFTDKRTGKVYIDHACRAVLVDETACDTWAHNFKQLGPTVAAFTGTGFEVLENGPVRGAVRTTACCGDSVLTRTFTLTAGSDEVKVHTKVDFREKHRTLKFTFPLTEESVMAKVACGTVTRKGYTGEEPCGSWIASGPLGIGNDSKYGYDTEDGEVRMTVLRGAIFADHYGQDYRDSYCEFMDMGIHTFDYSLFPYETPAKAERRAAELNFELRRIVASFHGGKLPLRMSCLENDNENIIISAVKPREDGNGNLVRFYEINGAEGEAELKLFGKSIRTRVAHHGLKTLADSGESLNAMEWEEEK